MRIEHAQATNHMVVSNESGLIALVPKDACHGFLQRHSDPVFVRGAEISTMIPFSLMKSKKSLLAVFSFPEEVSPSVGKYRTLIPNCV